MKVVPKRERIRIYKRAIEIIETNDEKANDENGNFALCLLLKRLICKNIDLDTCRYNGRNLYYFQVLIIMPEFNPDDYKHTNEHRLIYLKGILKAAGHPI